MPNEKVFLDYILEQLEPIGDVRYRKMFGGATLYCDQKVVGLICDNQLFIKPTPAGKSYIGEVLEAPPYQGAKNYYLIDEKLDDSDWLCELVLKTAQELPKHKKNFK
ncbi:MAG: TfoX/Sxy family protein [Candidatus Marinimicrobia bacterium]|nr:TfoX/Sxy family protein [Candidatus Neomarinimicrobiota bacterium]